MTIETLTTDSDEIDLLDLLIVIAENLKLLILVPLLTGITALGISFALPKTYESISILNPEKQGLKISGQVIASHIKSADVLEAVMTQINFEPDKSTALRVSALENLIQVSVGKQDQMVTLKTQGQSPEFAQTLNNTIWEKVLPTTIPGPKELARIQEQLDVEKSRLEAGNQLEKATATILASGQTTESNARLYGELLTANSERLRSIANLESQLEGLTLESLAQKPTLPELAIKPKKSMIAIAATLGSGFLVLLFIFARHALRGAIQDPKQCSKVQRLRYALGLKF